MTDKSKIINENAHSKIMKDMISYLDKCKESKNNCECSGVLKYNPNEPNELKKWSFLYQCDDVKKKVSIMENVTMNMLTDITDTKVEIYKVK